MGLSSAPYTIYVKAVTAAGVRHAWAVNKFSRIGTKAPDRPQGTRTVSHLQECQNRCNHPHSWIIRKHRIMRSKVHTPQHGNAPTLVRLQGRCSDVVWLHNWLINKPNRKAVSAWHSIKAALHQFLVLRSRRITGSLQACIMPLPEICEQALILGIDDNWV